MLGFMYIGQRQNITLPLIDMWNSMPLLAVVGQIVSAACPSQLTTMTTGQFDRISCLFGTRTHQHSQEYVDVSRPKC